MIYYWLHASKEREIAWDEAKKLSAHSHFEGGLERLERLANQGAAVTSAQVAAERALSEYRAKVAAIRHREMYGEKKQSELNVNIGLSHLGALRELGSMDRSRELPAEPIEDADYEVEE
jgi:hypothetical protein